MTRPAEGWAILFRSESRLDGKREYLGGRFDGRVPGAPPHLAGYATMVFQTREDAREHVRKHHGYIARRPDLRAEPFGWKVPLIVKVRVTVEIA